MDKRAQLIAAIIAYPMHEAGFSAAERERMAKVFAAELRIKNAKAFLELCKRDDELARFIHDRIHSSEQIMLGQEGRGISQR